MPPLDLRTQAFACFIATLFLFSSSSTNASRNYILNPGFEDIMDPPYSPYYPWRVENDYPSTTLSDESSYRTYPSVCNSIAKVFAPGDKSKHALQIRACRYVKDKRWCYSEVETYQLLQTIPEDSNCSMTYRYRIPKVAGNYGDLYLATSAGFSDSTIPLAANNIWLTFQKLPFEASGYDFFTIKLRQSGDCFANFDPSVKLQVDNVRVTCP